MERTLQQVLNTPAHRDFAFLVGAKSLSDSLVGYNNRPKYRRLVVPFETGEDPGDAFSRVPYEKGANLLLHLGDFMFLICFAFSFGVTFEG